LAFAATVSLAADVTGNWVDNRGHGSFSFQATRYPDTTNFYTFTGSWKQPGGATCQIRNGESHGANWDVTEIKFEIVCPGRGAVNVAGRSYQREMEIGLRWGGEYQEWRLIRR
jgi:hypothetical protein